jgi:hypothetical protein
MSKLPSPENTSDARVRDSIGDSAAAFAQAAFDALHVDDVAGHVAVVRRNLAAANVIGSVRDHLLLAKIAIFLHAVSAIPSKERRTMVERIQIEDGMDQPLGEHLVEMLDRLDGRRKAAMVGATFSAYAFGEIDFLTLTRLNASIQLLPTVEIASVRLLTNHRDETRGPVTGRSLDTISSQTLSNSGLASMDLRSGALQYDLNATGRKFLELELDRIVPSPTL